MDSQAAACPPALLTSGWPGREPSADYNLTYYNKSLLFLIPKIWKKYQELLFILHTSPILLIDYNSQENGLWSWLPRLES